MQLVGSGTVDRPVVGKWASRASDDPLPPGTGGPLVSLGWAVAVVALAAQVLAVLAVRATDDTASDAVTAGLLAQLPVLVVVAMGGCFRPRNQASLDRLGTRAARAEAALVREHDRVHELRATLAGVVTACRVLDDPHARLNPVRRGRLQQLHDRELERLERLLADRHEGARTVDLDAAIDPLVESVRLRGIEVTWPGAGCPAHGRPDDVIEVVHILLENAARHAAGRPIEVAVTAREHEVEIRVSDRGPGIPPDLLPRLFDRSTRGPGSSGQGIGLHIAQRLAQEMGGLLGLVLPGADHPGATFVLTLPAHMGAEPCRAVSS